MKIVKQALAVLLLLLWFDVSAQLKTGDKAPVFKTIDDAGNAWRLSDFVGKKIVVLYFYPAAMTSGCTAQACAYRDDKDMLSALNAEVVGISGDQYENLKLFKQVHNLNFTLVEDPKGKIAKKYGVPVSDGGAIKRTINGREVSLERGVTEKRWTFIIDLDGKIAYIDQEVDAAGDSKNVIEAIKRL